MNSASSQQKHFSNEHTPQAANNKVVNIQINRYNKKALKQKLQVDETDKENSCEPKGRITKKVAILAMQQQMQQSLEGSSKSKL